MTEKKQKPFGHYDRQNNGPPKMFTPESPKPLTMLITWQKVANGTEVANQLTLKQTDYSGAPNIITKILKRERGEHKKDPISQLWL